ncbi:hypothetical protein TVAG_392490 [Trichomonas vaginalis G3]|uniref:Uncharacterized protein n=1 Tax=Trichomonas vaginalis (strain ATCC PRA-98 / G3) TaxID=412133 RepID=A2DWV0_TRIV3|nr:armadillo (ARM) repeat-containing protein family [Trichomonas vaginalis G3]EAY15132.1 hypothetical protein TVAG_392490 [Trichomonas vaginalis G3]KAI5499176.1 armadillo (ARM) repeat-containing protein family [Trichomonas vaginalis G3]|eukprot:XP_001327355.1 hypothetical protein [Trichomonas vaginalis G3]
MLFDSLTKEEFAEFQGATFIFLYTFIDIFDDAQSMFNIQEIFNLTLNLLQNHDNHSTKYCLDFMTRVIMKFQLDLDLIEINEIIQKFYDSNIEDIIATNNFLIQYIRKVNTPDQIHQIYEIIINNLLSINDCSTFEVLLELFANDGNMIQHYVGTSHFLEFLKKFNSINNEFNSVHVKNAIKFLSFVISSQNDMEKAKNITNLINFMNLCEMFETTDSNDYFKELVELFICILDTDPQNFMKLFIDNNIVMISIDEFIHGTHSRSVIIIKLIEKLFAYFPDIMLDFLLSDSFFQTNNLLSFHEAESMDFCVFIFDVINFAKAKPDKLEFIVQQLEESEFLEDLNELMESNPEYFGEICQAILNTLKLE